MRFKGKTVRRSKMCVLLHEHHLIGEQSKQTYRDYLTNRKEDNWCMVVGRIVGKNATLKGKVPRDAMLMDSQYWNWGEDDSTPMFVRIVPHTGFSRTDMMYGEDGRTYVGHNGQVYIG